MEGALGVRRDFGSELPADFGYCSSTVHFFTDEDDVVADPYVHVLVDNLPSSRQHLVQPHGTKAAGWTPINSKVSPWSIARPFSGAETSAVS